MKKTLKKGLLILMCFYMIIQAMAACVNTVKESVDSNVVTETSQDAEKSTDNTQGTVDTDEEDFVESDTDITEDYFEQITMTPETVNVSFADNGELLYRIVRDTDASMAIRCPSTTSFSFFNLIS